VARFCTYEKTAIAAEYSKLLGLEEVEAFYCWRDCLSQNIYC
jgi:hypothetical protein